MLGFGPLGSSPLASPAVGRGTAPIKAPVSAVFGDAITTSDIELLFRGVFALGAEGFQVSDAYQTLRGIVGIAAETLAFEELVTYRGFTVIALLERMRIISDAQVIQGFAMTAQDTISFGAVATTLQGLFIIERLRFSDKWTASRHFAAYLADVTRLVDQLYTALPVAIVDALGISSTLATQRAILMLEAIKVGSVLQGSAVYNVTLAQVMRLRDSLGNFFGAEIAEDLGFAAGMLSAAYRAAQVTEDLVVAEALTPMLLLNIVAAEGVNITPNQIVQMLFGPTMLEGIEITAGYVAPDGGFVTWAMNTRTGGVTEYGNYAFNSFASIGDRYLGASSDGLYELDGDDDAGASIIGRIRGGFLQFGGTHLARLKEAYIAARGEGDWVLQIRTADDTVWNYAVSNRNMRSTKIHMGKGQRARYFAFELVSAGQDFDLDSLEFVPIVMQRRV